MVIHGDPCGSLIFFGGKKFEEIEKKNCTKNILIKVFLNRSRNLFFAKLIYTDHLVYIGIKGFKNYRRDH